MTDTRHEQWDVVSSVGLTALVVAAGRAVDTHRADGLTVDPFAEDFVAAAGPSTELPVRPGHADDDERAPWRLMSGYMGVRTRYFDEALLAATRAGRSQVVLLAAGLDARAHRLDWPDGVVVYEVDQPAMLEFKDRVLAERDAAHDDRPRCERRTVPVDLRDDWAAALTAAGFDPARPSVWLAEGLLCYLPADAEAALIESVDRLAAPGSSLVVEDLAAVAEQVHDPEMQDVTAQVGVDMTALLSFEERPPVTTRLDALGWRHDEVVAADVADGYGRALDPLTARFQGHCAFVTAQR